jgi:hypothetical protein
MGMVPDRRFSSLGLIVNWWTICGALERSRIVFGGDPEMPRQWCECVNSCGGAKLRRARVLVLQCSCRLECGVVDALIAERVSWVETYILMAICLACFLGTIGLFRLLLADPDQAMLIGGAAGLLIAVAAGGGYYTFLASCATCA